MAVSRKGDKGMSEQVPEYVKEKDIKVSKLPMGNKNAILSSC